MAAPMIRRICCKGYKNKTLLNSLYCFCSESNSQPDLSVNNNIAIDPNIVEKYKNAPVRDLKRHPGIVNVKVPKIPKKLFEAVDLILKKFSSTQLKTEAEKLIRYLWSRKLPIEEGAFSGIKEELLVKYISEANLNFNELSTEESEMAKTDIEKKVITALRKHIYHWEPIKYDAPTCMAYMIGRLNSDYTVLYRIFSEIASRDPQFKPTSMFDFGSGIGSSIWAVNSVWKKSVSEHYCVDSSGDMNTLARLLLQGGEEDNEMCFERVYFRQFFPASSKNKYNLVVSAFSLMEQPSKEERLKILFQLWQRTEDYMIIVENGTYDGFTVVSEARDLILQLSQHLPEDQNMKSHVFAPCPHDMGCPRGLRNDGTPCNFESKHFQFKGQQKSSICKVSKFSYVVLKKGDRDPSVTSWPRIVRPTSTPAKRVHCRTCAANGELQVGVITATKHGKELYKMAKACKWGDLLPVITVDKEDNDNMEDIPGETQTGNNETFDTQDLNVNSENTNVTSENVTSVSENTGEIIESVSEDIDENIKSVCEKSNKNITLISNDKNVDIISSNISSAKGVNNFSVDTLNFDCSKNNNEVETVQEIRTHEY